MTPNTDRSGSTNFIATHSAASTNEPLQGDGEVIHRPPNRWWTWLVLMALLAFGSRMGWLPDPVSSAYDTIPNPAEIHDGDDDTELDEEDDGCDPPSGNDGPSGGGNPCPGMPVWRVSEPYINLWIEDTPLTYRLSSGRWQRFTLTYKQRSGRDEALIAGFGTNGWECNFIGMLVVSNYNDLNYPMYHPAGGGFRPVPVDGSRDYRRGWKLGWSVPTDGDDAGGGNEETVGVMGGPTGSFNRYGFHRELISGFKHQLLSRRADRYGRPTVFNWADYTVRPDTYTRLNSVTDRDDRSTAVTYGNGTFPYLITALEDPYGRSATFTYNEKGWLTNIVDMAGMSASFKYNEAGVLTNMHTPYGDTAFRHFEGEVGDHPLNRAVEITEPNGDRQLYAYRDNGVIGTDSAGGTFACDDGATAYRNSYHWDRNQFAVISVEGLADYLDMPVEDYWKASLKHWTLKDPGNQFVSDTPSATAGPVLQPDIDDTRCHQVFYQYQGQSTPGYNDTLRRVTKIVWNGTDYAEGTSPAIEIERNAWGRPTSITYHYQGHAATYTQTYDAEGRILQTVTGPRGEAVRGYGYHDTLTNLLTSVTNALDEVIRYTHDLGSLKVTGITHPSGLVTTNFYYSSGAMAGFLRETIDLGFRTNRFTYTNGNLCIQTNELGLVTCYGFFYDRTSSRTVVVGI